MFRLALSSHIYLFAFQDTNVTLWSSCALKHVLWQRVFQSASEFKVRNLIVLQVMCVGSLAGVTYLRYTVLMSSNKSETVVHCCDPALSVLVMFVSRNAFHVVSALQSFAFINSFPAFHDHHTFSLLVHFHLMQQMSTKCLKFRKHSAGIFLTLTRTSPPIPICCVFSH